MTRTESLEPAFILVERYGISLLKLCVRVQYSRDVFATEEETMVEQVSFFFFSIFFVPMVCALRDRRRVARNDESNDLLSFTMRACWLAIAEMCEEVIFSGERNTLFSAVRAFVWKRDGVLRSVCPDDGFAKAEEGFVTEEAQRGAARKSVRVRLVLA